MLKSVTLENFFSFGKTTTIELNSGVNLLIGINASGKSNFLKALRLLKVGVVDGQLAKLILEEWGGWDEVINYTGGQSEKIVIEYQFTLPHLNFFSYTLILEKKLKIISEKLTIAFEKDKKKQLAFETINFNGIVSGKVGYIGGGLIEFLEALNYNTGELYLKKYIEQYATSPVLNFLDVVQDIHSYNYFDISPKSPVRSPSSFGIDNYLFSTGKNLNTIIQKIKNNQFLAYGKIEEQLKNVNPYFRGIGFNLFGNKSYLLLHERNLDKAISIEHISDGTLYYLLHLAIFYNRERGKVVVIDEPEAGLHPDMIHSIAKAIKHAAADGTQLFIATHSPLLLNDFELEDVIIFEKDEHNQTCIKTEEDFENANPDYLVGQLWLNGEIGGKRW